MAPSSRPAVDVLVHPHDRVGESPVWSVSEQALYWVDIDGRRLHRHRHGKHREWPLPERAGCIALHAEGGLLAALESGLHRLWPEDDGRAPVMRRLTDAPFDRPGMRFNDGRCDRDGRFWVSSMVMDMSLGLPAGVLYRYDGRGLVPMVDGLITGNGLGFSPDGRTLYLSDSHPSVQRIWAFDLDTDGNLHRRRLFVDMNLHAGRPDGAAVDAEGGYWICGNDAGQVHRFAPDGRLDRSLALPVSKPAMCAFGGAALDQLYITSITPGRPAEGFDAALDGAVLVARPGAVGLPEAAFRP